MPFLFTLTPGTPFPTTTQSSPQPQPQPPLRFQILHLSQRQDQPQPQPQPTPTLPYALTLTTTFTTTLSASIGAIIHPSLPSPTTTPPTLYTTPTALPSNSAVKAYPQGLPILVVTQLDAAIWDVAAGRVLSTATRVFGPTGAVESGAASAIGSSSAETGKEQGAWKGWTWAERGGVLVASTVCAVVLMGVLGYVLLKRWKSRRRRRGRIWWVEREQEVERGALLGGKEEAKERKIEGLEDIEVGPAALRSFAELLEGEDGGEEEEVLEYGKGDVLRADLKCEMSGALQGSHDDTDEPYRLLRERLATDVAQVGRDGGAGMKSHW
ncbi:MAG: hypothetical protein Q9167_002128 [Letrouitia subvulpina]